VSSHGAFADIFKLDQCFSNHQKGLTNWGFLQNKLRARHQYHRHNMARLREHVDQAHREVGEPRQNMVFVIRHKERRI
jgi:threonine aldolase